MIFGHKLLPLLLIAVLISFTACKRNRWDVDVSEVPVQVKINRFHDELFQIDTNQYDQQIRSLHAKYPDIFQAYWDYIFHTPRQDTAARFGLFRRNFLTNPYMDSLHRDVNKAFPPQELGRLEGDLTDAFKHVKHYFPKEQLPRFSTIITGFAFQTFTIEKDLCIGLDLFLGKDYKYYQSVGVDYAGYQTRRFEKPYVVPQVLKTWFGDKYERDPLIDKTLLSKMIYAGKTLYFLDAMQPDLQDSLKIEYTKAHLDWCKESETEIWKHLTAKEALFSTDASEEIRYLNDGPFTNAEGLPQESPPRLGEWVGWQIVRKYMDENKDISLDALFREKDYRKILKESRYKPK